MKKHLFILLLQFIYSQNTLWNTNYVYGCMDKAACNYSDENTADNGYCIYPEKGYDCDGKQLGELDCNGDEFISIVDEENYVQVLESDHCYQYLLLSDAFNAIKSFDLSINNYIYVFLFSYPHIGEFKINYCVTQKHWRF